MPPPQAAPCGCKRRDCPVPGSSPGRSWAAAGEVHDPEGSRVSLFPGGRRRRTEPPAVVCHTDLQQFYSPPHFAQNMGRDLGLPALSISTEQAQPPEPCPRDASSHFQAHLLEGRRGFSGST